MAGPARFVTFGFEFRDVRAYTVLEFKNLSGRGLRALRGLVGPGAAGIRVHRALGSLRIKTAPSTPRHSPCHHHQARRLAQGPPLRYRKASYGRVRIRIGIRVRGPLCIKWQPGRKLPSLEVKIKIKIKILIESTDLEPSRGTYGLFLIVLIIDAL